jgi:hypothetical protein
MTIAQVKRRRKQMKVDPRFKNVMKSAKDKQAFKEKRKK